LAESSGSSPFETLRPEPGRGFRSVAPEIFVTAFALGLATRSNAGLWAMPSGARGTVPEAILLSAESYCLGGRDIVFEWPADHEPDP
jgi:hypothetical protein